MYNEKRYLLREYEILRHFLLMENEPTSEEIKKLEKEILSDLEYLEFAVSVTKDSFGLKLLNGLISAWIIIENFEKVDYGIKQKLLYNLLFEYQDEEKTIPLIITDCAYGMSYLKAVLINTKIYFKPDNKLQLTNALIKSIERKMDFELLTIFFLREDIENKYKQMVVDFVDEENLYLLKKHIEETLVNFNIPIIDFEDVLSDEKVLETFSEFDAEENPILADVVNMIDKKLYSE